jgi:hypothetical protein
VSIRSGVGILEKSRDKKTEDERKVLDVANTETNTKQFKGCSIIIVALS